ncbi:hypothetical protein KO498_08700 [Lentibacter algarum]|uniref:hypothetical protein n=1 Tax=Lentibacter algarum TaxID=576131 RepID=UPI001C0670D9|nr:hypothetical protein [Lentibacter algarum]MBU2981893.1 hypothetical protein [Lentibacter algarum]
MTAIAKTQPLPRRTLWATRRIHMPAFFGALVLAPILDTALTFFLIIPLFALYMGAPFYLLIGTPTLLWMLSQAECRPVNCAVAAVLSSTTASALVLAYSWITQDESLSQAALLYLFFGAIFAPIWGATFGYLYMFFTKPTA